MNIKINDTKKTNKVNIRIEIAGLQKFILNPKLKYRCSIINGWIR